MTTVDEELNELIDFNPTEMHTVGKAANGTSFLVAKSAAEGASGGLLSAEQVRELVAKSEADDQEAFRASTAPVTLSGSPAGLAEMMARIHGAPVRKAEMSTKSVNDLPDSAFAYIEPGGEKDADGKTTPRSKRHFPVHDEAHTRNALSRAPQSPFGEKAMPKIRAAAKKYDIEVAKAADPGSPEWESQDATTAETVTAMILACIPQVRALAMREATEVGAGHTEDICDVITLQCAIDSLTDAAQNVGAFAVSEHAEAGETGPVTKAQPEAAPSPAAPAASETEEHIMTQTTEVSKAEDTATATTTTTTEQAPVPVSKAAAMAELLGITTEKLAEIGAQYVAKALAETATTPQTPGAEAAPTENARIIPGTDTVQSPVQPADEVSKAAATQLATAFGEAVAPVVTQLGELTTQVGAQLERVEKMAAQPDNRRSPLLNGATGESGPALRDALAASPEWQTVTKALAALPEGPAKDEAKRELALQALRARFS